jgi:hypothetical protein
LDFFYRLTVLAGVNVVVVSDGSSSGGGAFLISLHKALFILRFTWNCPMR